MALSPTRDSAALGAGDQAAHRHLRQGRRHAALVCREEHRYPAVPDDPSLSDDEIATIAKWADSGAPRGNPADMPPAKVYADRKSWAIGTPDLVVKTQELTVKAGAPDWWGEIPASHRSDRGSLRRRARDQGSQRRALVERDDKATVGGRFVFHHMIWRTQVLDVDKTSEQADPLSFILDEETVNWPVHEVGRNADFFDPSRRAC